MINDIGVIPKKETNDKLLNNPSKTNISQNTKNNIFGNPSKPNSN